MNSKTGLYPLYVAYSIYVEKCKEYPDNALTIDKKNAIWRDTLANNIFVICKTPMAKEITRRTLAGYKNYKVNAHYFEDLVNMLEHKQRQFIDKITRPNYWERKDNKKMEFDAIVGNPPYQLLLGNTTGNSSKAKAIYNIFLDGAINLNPNYISMIMPARWMTKSVEGISDKWVDDMINSNKFEILHDYLNSSDCFPAVDIKGGICYFLYNNEYNDKCSYYLHENDKCNFRKQFLNENNIGVVIRDYIAMNIIEKIEKVEKEYYSKIEKNFSYIVGPKDFFTTKHKLTSSWKGFKNEEDTEHIIKYYYSEKGKRDIGYISPKDIDKNIDAIKYNKVFIPAAGGTGNDQLILGSPIISEGESACSQTYLAIGYNNTLNKNECINVTTYLKTKFLRYLVSILKKTQNGPKKVYQFVPMQDFTNQSDIDWNKNVEDIDKQLYKKYKLNEEEIKYIENKIKYAE